MVKHKGKNVGRKFFHPVALVGIVFLSFTLSLLFVDRFFKIPPTRSYWMWAGIVESDLPKDDEALLYVYQGVIERRGGQTVLKHKGIFPYPMGRKEIGIVYRITELVAPEDLVGVFLSASNAWEGHGIRVATLQLDYDCPTSKIDDYAIYIEKLRAVLPSSYSLSITGLGDWLLSGDPRAVARLGRAADDVTFQLYRDREPLADIDRYPTLFKRVAFPFHVGLLASARPPDWLDVIRANSYYHGTTLFIQK